MARRKGSRGPAPLPYELHQTKLWLAECAKDALGDYAKAQGVSAGMAITLLIAEKTGRPIEELLRDANQDQLFDVNQEVRRSA